MHTSFDFSLPRRNGINEVVTIREMYGLMELGEQIMHTGFTLHQFLPLVKAGSLFFFCHSPTLFEHSNLLCFLSFSLVNYFFQNC